MSPFWNSHLGPRPIKLLMAGASLLLVFVGVGAYFGVTRFGATLLDAQTPSSGAPSNPAVSNPPPVTGYLCESTGMGSIGSWAIYLDTSSGTLYQAQAEMGGVVSSPGSVSLQGPTVTLEDQEDSSQSPDLLGSGSYAAQLSGGTLSIAVPWSDGSVHNYPCQSGGIDQYNQDVSQMQSGVAQAQQQAAAAQQQAKADSDIDQAAQALNSAYQALQNDASSLQNDQSLSAGANDVASAQKDLQTTQNDLQTTQADSSNEQGPGTCGADASTVGADASTLAADQSSVQADQGGLGADESGANGDISALQSDLQVYQQALSGDPGHQDQAPSQGDVNAAIQAVQGQEAQDNSTMQGDLNRVAGYVQQANQMASAAQSACGL